MMNIYDNYWTRMKLREEFGKIGRIPAKRWCPSEGLNEIEKVYFNRIRESNSILEIGSGDNTLQKKFRQSGYEGAYHTMDISREFPHEFSDIKEIEGVYDAIVMLQVIEHMNLNEFGETLEVVESHLAPEGKVIISTTQPQSIIPWESWDMTHVQHYPLHDLYTLFRTRGFSVECYRVYTQRPPSTNRERIRLFLRKLLCYILGVDWADSVALILQKESSPDTTARGADQLPKNQSTVFQQVG